jgi:hypothetical protein
LQPLTNIYLIPGCVVLDPEPVEMGLALGTTGVGLVIGSGRVGQDFMSIGTSWVLDMLGWPEPGFVGQAYCWDLPGSMPDIEAVLELGSPGLA